MKSRIGLKALAVAITAALAPSAHAGGQACPAGNFSATGEEPCLPCSEGQYQPDTGQMFCLDASPGFFVATTGASDQDECPLGRFQPLAGASECDAAAAGTFVGMTGATEAEECDIGSFQPLTGQSECDPAPPGSFVEITGADEAQECSPGTFQALSGQSVCDDAPAGRFVDVAGADTAQECPLGTFQPMTGQTSCILAPEGQFVGETGAIEALECGRGTFQPLTGQSACDNAPPGRFVATTGAITALECSPGFFQPLAGQSACDAAPPGRFVDVAGAEEATACALGTFQPLSGQVSCDDAAPGRFVGVTGATLALECGLGTFQPLAGQSACEEASPGRFVDTLGAIDAEDCAIGRFQPLAGQASCDDAPAGQFVGLTGATTATDCAPGSFQALAGQSVCDNAPPGRFVADAGATAALECAPGTFQPAAGQVSCNDAQPGFFVAGAGALEATTCPDGSVSFVASPACRQAPTPGPNVVSPAFGSNLGRGGLTEFSQTLNAEGDTLDVSVANNASAIGAASPLTRLTLNALNPGMENSISSATFVAGTTLDEGQQLPLTLTLSAAALGQQRFQFQLETDEGVDLGLDGATFEFELIGPVDGSDLSITLVADRPRVAADQDFALDLIVRNPGNTDAIDVPVSLTTDPALTCSFVADTSDGAVAMGNSLTQIGEDSVVIPARGQVRYVGTCRSESSPPATNEVSATLTPPEGFVDVDPLNNADDAAIEVVPAGTGEAELQIELLSATDFLDPNSAQQVVFQVTNGATAVDQANLTLNVLGLADVSAISCGTPPVPCGTLRSAGRDSQIQDVALSLGADETIQVTIDLSVRTLEAQPIVVEGLVTAPPGTQSSSINGSAEISATGGVFNDSFETP